VAQRANTPIRGEENFLDRQGANLLQTVLMVPLVSRQPRNPWFAPDFHVPVGA
jgi:hypothetical protein